MASCGPDLSLFPFSALSPRSARILLVLASCILRTLCSSCSRVAAAKSRADCSSSFTAFRRFLILGFLPDFLKLSYGHHVGSLHLEQNRTEVEILFWLTSRSKEGRSTLALHSPMTKLLDHPLHGIIQAWFAAGRCWLAGSSCCSHGPYMYKED